MCGIVAYVGQQNARGILIEGLKRLEYRGYDSSGIAILDGPKPPYLARAVGKDTRRNLECKHDSTLRRSN